MAGGLFRCSYDFKAETENDLPLVTGELVYVTQEINQNWYEGATEKKFGQFPANFVERIFEKKPERVGIGLSSFEAQENGDLNINKGVIVGITENIDDNWSSGYTTKESGIFPLNFVKEIQFCLKNDILDNNNTLVSSSEISAETNGFYDLSYSNVKPYAEAIDNFIAQEADEISVTIGANIELVKEVDNFWLEGRLDGKQGKFPKTFVKVVIDLPKHLKIEENNDLNDHNSFVPRAKAVYMFVGTKPGEISFDKGDEIILTERINKEWLKGKVGISEGMFPANHVEIVVDLPFTENRSIEIPKSDVGILAYNPSSVTYPNNRQSVPSSSPIKTKIIAGTITPAQQPESPRKRSFRKLRPPPPVNARNNFKQSPAHSPSFKTGKLFYQKEDDKPQNAENVPNSGNQKKTTTLPSGDFQNRNRKPIIAARPSKKSSLSKKDVQVMHQFELTHEKVFHIDNIQTAQPSKPLEPKKSQTLPSKPNAPTRSTSKIKAPPRPSTFKVKNQEKLATNSNEFDLLCSSPPKLNHKKLPKPLAPMPSHTDQSKPRPTSLNLLNGNRNSKDLSESPSLSPISMIDSKNMTVGFTKDVTMNDNENVIKNFENRRMSRSETDPQISKPKNQSLNLALTPDPISKVQSLYFATPSPTSPEKRHQTLDAMLQRSASLRTSYSVGVTNRKTSTLGGSTPTSIQGSNDSLSQQSQQLKRIDTEIAETKSKIEAEAHLLSGVETLLDFVSDDKLADLLVKQEHHNVNIVELNEELNALEDEKSYLLASFGRTDDVKNRVVDLERQIETYLDNCEQLRRMQDVAVIEELPEIRDNIEFCENMVDTLQEELNELRDKLRDMGELEQTNSSPDPDQHAKREKNQKKVIEELINTEKSYVQDLRLLMTVMKYLEEETDVDINLQVLFCNLPDIVELSSNLLIKLEEANRDDHEADEIPGNIASCFIDISSEMKECYAAYCHNYEDAQILMEKCEEDVDIWNTVLTIIETICKQNETPVFRFSSYLIKPVQRVLKYPLLLSELLKNHSESGLNREYIKFAFTTVTDVATAINEFKRRKDLVQKYRDEEDNIGKKVQKLNWHSVAKKSSRINQRITQFTGFNTQTVDEKFSEEEKRFRGLEKLIKLIVKNIAQFLEDFKANFILERQCAESLRQFHEGNEASEAVIQYCSKVTMISEEYACQAIQFIEEHVNVPLKELLLLFHGPFRLIQKRNVKCLDYDRAKNRATRAKDSKEREQTQEELQNSQNIYLALNTQLLEELPTLYEKCSQFTRYCLSNFAEAYKRYLGKAYTQLLELYELPFITKDVDMFEHHQQLVGKAMVQLSNLSFIPSTNKELQRRSQTQVINTAILKASFFVDFVESSTSTDQSSHPLIDFSSENATNGTAESPKRLNTSTQESQNTFDQSSNEFIQDGAPKTQYIVKYAFEAESDTEITVAEGTEVNVLRKCDKNGNSEWWHVEQDGRRGYIAASFLEVKTNITFSDTNNLKDRSQTDSDVRKIPSPILTSERRDIKNEVKAGDKTNLTSSNNEETNIGKSTFYASVSSVQSSNNLCKASVALQNDSSLPTSKQTRSKGEEQSSRSNFVVEFDFEAVNSEELTVREGQVVKVLRKQDQKGNEEWWYIEYEGRLGYVPRDYLAFVNKDQMC